MNKYSEMVAKPQKPIPKRLLFHLFIGMEGNSLWKIGF